MNRIALLAVLLLGCEGPAGEIGPMGPEGALGPSGTQGAPGQDADVKVLHFTVSEADVRLDGKTGTFLYENDMITADYVERGAVLVHVSNGDNLWYPLPLVYNCAHQLAEGGGSSCSQLNFDERITHSYMYFQHGVVLMYETNAKEGLTRGPIMNQLRYRVILLGDPS